MAKAPRTRSPRPSKPPYHHGDLHAALVRAGLEIVSKEGVEALSLRAVARRAKVSHSAPYHHFEHKAELLAAVAAAGFDLMVAAIQEQATSAQARSGIEALRAVGKGYLSFALANGAIFRLMFRPELTRPADHPVLLEAEARTFGKLLEAITICQATGELPGRDPRPPAAACWSMVHGLAMLHVEQVLAETPLGEVPIEELVHLIVETAIAGVRSRP